MTDKYDGDDEPRLDEFSGGGAFEPLETIPGATANRDQMAELHQLICIALSARIRAGIWSSGDIAAATKFLKDNNVTADVGDNKALQKLRDEMETKQKTRREERTYLSEQELVKLATEELNNEIWH